MNISEKNSSGKLFLFFLLSVFLISAAGSAYLVWKHFLPSDEQAEKGPPPLPTTVAESLPSVPPEVETQPSTQTSTTLPANTETVLPPPPETLGSAQVMSTPAGAQIFLNGFSTGFLTPALIGNLTLGNTYHIRLVKNGYLNIEAVYTPTNSNTQPILLPLQPAPPTHPTPPKSVRRNSGSTPLHQTPPPPSPSLRIGY